MQLGAVCTFLVACGGGAPASQSPGNSAGSAKGSAAPASTDTPAPGAPDKQRERLEVAGHTLKSNVTPPGKSERYGHAETIVNAPIVDLRKAVLDFSNYKALAPEKFKTARMIAKENGTVDIYFQVPVMKGMMTIWYVTRFPQDTRRDANGVEVLDGKFVKGSIDDMELQLTLRSIAPDKTILSCDLLIVPQLPAPQSAIDETLRDAAGDAVDALRKRVEPPPPQTSADAQSPPAQPSPALPQGATPAN